MAEKKKVIWTSDAPVKREESPEMKRRIECSSKHMVDMDYLDGWITQYKDAKPKRNYVLGADTKYSRAVEAISLADIFSPYLSEVSYRFPNINYTTLDNFANKFGITSDILEPMAEVWSEFGPNAILAGGKLQDWFENKSCEESTNDYDVFFLGNAPTYAKVTNKNSAKAGWEQTAKLGYLSEWQIQGKKFQFIYKSYDEPENIIEDFDIRACSICTNGEYIWWIKGCLHDIRDKVISYLNPKPSINHFMRIQKYIKKGYSIKAPDFTIAAIKMLDKVLEIGMNSDSKWKFDKAKWALFDREYTHDREDFQYDGFIPDEGVPRYVNINIPNGDPILAEVQDLPGGYGFADGIPRATAAMITEEFDEF